MCAVVPLIALAALTGCAPGDDVPAAPAAAARPFETPATVVWVPDVHVVDDVTRDEYLAGFAAFASCMRDAGHHVYLHDRGVILDYSYPYEGEIDLSFAHCYTTRFRDVDIAWQLAHEYDSEAVRTLIECIAETGASPARDADGVHRQVAELGIDPVACTRP